jgi:methionine-S-sulfoxide reductase
MLFRKLKARLITAWTEQEKALSQKSGEAARDSEKAPSESAGSVHGTDIRASGDEAQKVSVIKEIYFAGGCFWGVEKYFSYIQGVAETCVGYANGRTINPGYEDVRGGDTGHAETVKVTYDTSLVSLESLLSMYFDIIDPTSVNRQGADEGDQYRTGVYYADPDDESIILNALGSLQALYTSPIAVEAAPLKWFFTAEAFHQKYLDKNPSGYCHISNDLFMKARSSSRGKNGG